MDVLNEDTPADVAVAPVAVKASRRRVLTEIRSLARSHTRTAINVLVGIMRSQDATPAARVSAANAILDRGWGRAVQPLENGDGPLELIHRIERVIVHPDRRENVIDLLPERTSRLSTGREKRPTATDPARD